MSATVLLVDGDSSNREGWEALLLNHGYKVFLAENGKTAIAQCSRIQPDLILIQGSLPDVSGAEVCGKLKSDPATRFAPVVLMLPAADPEHMRSREALDADDFWARPGSRWEALNRIQAVLQLKSCIDQQAESVVLSLARSIEAKDPTTAGHSERVLQYAVQLGRSLEMNNDDLQALWLACIVHDIGKVAVPDCILFKPGRLTSEEMEIMRQHPVIGENICAPLRSFRDALPFIRHHHERMDGTGYPDGLAGAEIPLAARILQVADVYDALTSNRPYRRALTPEMAFSVMATEVERGWLDCALVSQLMEICEQPSLPVRTDRSIFVDCQGMIAPDPSRRS